MNCEIPIGHEGSWHCVRPSKERGMEWFVDMDFASGWTNADADNAENVNSRTG